MIDEEKMTSERIVRLLENRHAGEEWAFLRELRTCTGHLYKPCYIDCYAVGLWEKTRGFFAYEIKVSRSDFLKDIQEFTVKQADAIANSTQFYYVCPHKLIDPSEVPEICGLMWADAGGVKIKKVAKIRELEKGLEPGFIAALLRASSEKKTWNPMWKYLGKDISESDLRKIAKDLYETKRNKDISYEVSEEVRKINAEGKSVMALERIRSLLKTSRWGGNVWNNDVIDSICKKITDAEEAVLIANRIRNGLEEINKNTTKLSKLLSTDSNEDNPL